jgi:hypothetical protein
MADAGFDEERAKAAVGEFLGGACGVDVAAV